MKKNKLNNNQGFSLIEMILYIAIVSIFISGAILYGWNIIYGRVKSQVQLDVNYNLKTVSSRIDYELRNALDIYSVSSNELCLEVDDTSHNPTRLYLSSGKFRVAWGGGSTDCTGMTNDLSLSNESVVVSSLNFTDLSSAGGSSKNIKYSLTIDSLNLSNRQEWDKNQTYFNTVEIRSN